MLSQVSPTVAWYSEVSEEVGNRAELGVMRFAGTGRKLEAMTRGWLRVDLLGFGNRGAGRLDFAA